MTGTPRSSTSFEPTTESSAGCSKALYIFASYAGAPKDPDWYFNLVSTPEVSVELGDETFSAVAAPVEREERDRVYAVQASRFPNFAEYETKTTRLIPVVRLERS
jgi:deazaflavin-dependent oxidoreductase (nitroreductase family)